MKNGILRKRFLRELNVLRKNADYRFLKEIIKQQIDLIESKLDIAQGIAQKFRLQVF